MLQAMALLLAAALASALPHTGAVRVPPLPPNATQTWFDDFDGPALRPEWSVADWAHLDACYQPEQVSLSGGSLVLAADRRNGTVCGSGGGVRDYVSGLVNTTGRFHQLGGIFEVRAKLLNNSALGLHPTFWLLGDEPVCWPTMGELDIIEVSGKNSPKHTWYSGNVHAGAQCKKDLGGSVTRQYNYGDLAGWHVWGLWWEPALGRLTFTLDGEVRPGGVYSDPAVVALLSREAYIILGLAVMDRPGDEPVPGATQLPQSVEFDWVRAAQWRS